MTHRRFNALPGFGLTMGYTLACLGVVVLIPIAALFLKRFAAGAKSWAHFYIFAWNPNDRPHGPAGGEAQAIRAIAKMLADRFGA